MRDEEKTILLALNRGLGMKGISHRFRKHPFRPMPRWIEVEIGNRIVFVHDRAVSVGERSLGSFRISHLGEFRGRGWLASFVDAAVQAVEKEVSR